MQRSDVVAMASTTAMVTAPVDAASRIQATHESYVENRVLTPSVYRTTQGTLLSPGREFGTQTGYLITSLVSIVIGMTRLIDGSISHDTQRTIGYINT